jgi:mRNA-degrading endonuclease RelE of RelBE toxin-antitoxin system
MDNQKREISWALAQGREVLDGLSAEDRKKVDAAIKELARKPPPGGKIVVPVDGDEITVLYELDDADATIEIIKIKRRGVFKNMLRGLKELADFTP